MSNIHVSAVDYHKNVGKKIEPDGKGGIKKTRLPNPPKGTAVVETFVDLEEYFEWRQAQTPHVMRVAGNFEPGTNGLEITYKDLAEEAHQISATNDYLAFRPGGAIATSDIDVKRPDEVAALWPENPRTFKTHQEAADAFSVIAPWLATIAMAISGSASSNILNGSQKPLTDNSSRHLDFAVDDGTQIPRILEQLHDLCWLHGYGWAFVDKGGVIRERSLVDLVMARPHQPDYITPVLKKCKHAGGRFTFFPGDILVTADVPELTDSEMEAIEAAKQKMRDALQSKSTVTKSARLKAVQAQIIATNPDADRSAKHTAARMMDGVLSGDIEIIFDDGEAVTADELIISGAQYDKRACLDPVEPDYGGGRCVGIFYWNDGGQPIVYSLAHYATSYQLRMSMSRLEALVTAYEDDTCPRDVLLSGLALFEGTPTEGVAIERATAKAFSLGARTAALTEEIKNLRHSHGIRPVTPQAATEGASRRVFGVRFDKQLWEPDWPVLVLAEGQPPRLAEHIDNYAYLLDKYGFDIWFDEVRKDVMYSHRRGKLDPGKPTLFDTLFSSLCDLNGLNTTPSGKMIDAIAQRHLRNPVRDVLCGLVWDGVPRIELFAEACSASNIPAAKASWRVFFTSGCAASDKGEIGMSLNPEARATYEYILCLLSGQGANKTKGMQQLLPPDLRPYFGNGLTLNLNDKDTVKTVLSHWVTELGEIEATFSKSGVSHLKAFASGDLDNIRLPYGKVYNKFPRTTIFIGTVNTEKFLHDRTGSRRFLPLSIDRMPMVSDSDSSQMWAEAWHRYVSGEQWWPTSAEDVVLFEAVGEFEEESRIYEQLRNCPELDWYNALAMAREGVYKRGTADQILTEYITVRDNPSSQSEVVEAVKKLWTEVGAVREGGALQVKGVMDPSGNFHASIKVNASGGNNRGWLLPVKKRDVSADLPDELQNLANDPFTEGT